MHCGLCGLDRVIVIPWLSRRPSGWRGTWRFAMWRQKALELGAVAVAGVGSRESGAGGKV